MPSLFNSALLTPRNILVIGVIATLSHIIAAPLYKAVGKKN